MKKMLFSLTATVLFIPNSYCQSNNPQNQSGIDVVTLAHAIQSDYSAGKIKEVTQETINHYFEKYLPNYPKVELDAFNTLFTVLKNSDNSSIIKNAGFSEQGTTFLKKSLESYSITKLVDEVNESKISEKEKESILSVLAINYNLIKPYFKENQPPAGKGPNAESFELEAEHNSASHSKGLPSIIWGGLGYITGFAICGPSCGYVGAAIGIVFGGWISEGSIRTTGYGNSNSSGSSNQGGGWSPQP